VLQAIEVGALPELKTLSFRNMGITSYDASARALVRAFKANQHDIQAINFRSCFYTMNDRDDKIFPSILGRFLHGIAIAEEHANHGERPFCFNDLNLSSSFMVCDDAVALSRAIITKVPMPMTLNLSENPLIGDSGMAAIFKSLSYRYLVGLNIDGACLGTYASKGLAALLRQGNGLNTLIALDVSNNGLRSSEGLLAFLEAIMEGWCPQLRELYLNNCNAIKDKHGRVLGQALRKGSLHQLRVLNMDQSKPTRRKDDWHLPIMDALAAGACPSLICLATPLGNGTTASSILALGLATGRMPYLEKLLLNCDGVPRYAAHYGVRTILKALSQTRSCIHLSDITVTGHPMGRDNKCEPWSLPSWCKMPKWWRGRHVRVTDGANVVDLPKPNPRGSWWSTVISRPWK